MNIQAMPNMIIQSLKTSFCKKEKQSNVYSLFKDTSWNSTCTTIHNKKTNYVQGLFKLAYLSV